MNDIDKIIYKTLRQVMWLHVIFIVILLIFGIITFSAGSYIGSIVLDLGAFLMIWKTWRIYEESEEIKNSA